MTQRHVVQSDATLLVTTNTLGRQPVFANPSHAREAIECLYRVQQLHPFFLFAFVIMPNHCHFLIRVPSPNSVSNVMNTYKSGLAFDIGIPKLWQRRFHTREVENFVEAKNYIHWNPLRAGLIEDYETYPWSSACGKWDLSPLPDE